MGDAISSLGVAKKIADTFEVTLDSLVGNIATATFDKPTVRRILLIQKLKEEDKKRVFALLDAFLRAQYAKSAYT